jgi:hypothetical protein
MRRTTVNHGSDRTNETAVGDATPTSVANPRRTQLAADGSPTTAQSARATSHA